VIVREGFVVFRVEEKEGEKESNSKRERERQRSSWSVTKKIGKWEKLRVPASYFSGR